MLEITRNHIQFYDEQKLRLAVRALLSSEPRRKLAERYMNEPKIKRMSPSFKPKIEDLTPAKKISIHRLIPPCTRDDSFRHRRARGRKQAREAIGAGHHLQSNLKGFIKPRKANTPYSREVGDTTEERLLYYCTVGGPQPYAKWARRWAKKLGIVTPEMAQVWSDSDEEIMERRIRRRENR